MRRPFTFFEMLIVAVILAVASAIVLPGLSKIPHRLTIDSALTGIRTAISETAMRARATGQSLELVLSDDGSSFSVQAFSSDFSAVRGWTPPLDKPEDDQNSNVAISSKDCYELSSEIEWLPEESDLDQSGAISFAFFEDGQASGRTVSFAIGKQRFILDVDKLTGAPLISEVER